MKLICTALTLFGTCTALTTQATASTLNAAPFAVNVSGVTNTQAVLDYAPPGTSPCEVAVSPSPTYSPLVYDVDPTKFSGANMDNRVSLFHQGKRDFVIGQRAAQRALDGNLYSRALQANTTYYFEVICAAASAQASGSFTTATVAVGNTFADPLPVDPANPGEYAWPTVSMNDRTQQIIDPQTGVLLRRISLPQDRDITQTAQPFQNVRSGGWSNASAALSNNDGNQAATIAGNNTATLLLEPQDDVNFNGYISSFKGMLENNTTYLNWFQVTINASTSNSACSSNPSRDCNVLVCLTIDGVNCNPNGQTFEQVLTPTLTNYTFGTSGTAIDLWQATGKRPFNGTEVAIHQGQVLCDGSSTVNWNGGDYFATFWSAGSMITVNGTAYPIKQVNTPMNLELGLPCASTNGQPVNYTGMNFGVLVRKQTVSADTISVQYAQANYALGIFPFFDYTGEYDLCGTTAVTGPTGNPGYNCSMYQNGPVFWIDGTTGETHLLALNEGVFYTNTGSCGAFDSIVFDTTNPDTWYCGGNYPQKVQYFGNHSDPMNTAPYPGFIEEQVNVPNCNATAAPANEPCLVFTGLTGNTALSSLIQAFDPSFDANAFSNMYLAYVENGLLVFRLWRSNYGSIGWTVLFDPNATSNGEPGNAGCLGSAPGCVVAAVASWKSPNARWCAQKSNDPMKINGWMAVGSYGWSNLTDTTPGVGPYVSNVDDGTALSSAVNAAGGPSVCPSNSFGVTGNQCTTVHVSGEPYDPSPCTASAAACNGAVESGAPGALGPAEPGDYFTAINGSEIMRLIAKGGSGNTEWTFQRGYNGVLGTSTANPMLETTCNVNPVPANVNGSNEWYWNYAADPHGLNTDGNTILTDANGVGAHFFIQNGSQVIAYDLDSRCAGQICYQNTNFSSIPQLMSENATNVQQSNPFFAGVQGNAEGNYVQSHPAGPGWNASFTNSAYFLDGRPFNGGPLSGSVLSDGSNPATPMGGQLWKFSSEDAPVLHRKLVPTFAFSGNKALLDVSGPTQGNVIGGTAADAYKYCVVFLANECVQGSAPGDIYVNAPFVTRPFCHFPSQAGSMPDEFDLCIGDNATIYNSLMQLNGAVTDLTGGTQRMLGKGLSRARITDPFWHVHALANSDWIMFLTDYAQDVGNMIFAMQLPPIENDGVDRTTFEPVTTQNVYLPNGTSSAYLEFGYAEYGAPANLYCTTRAEVCVTTGVGGAINLNAPYYWEQTEAAQITPTPCASGCSITLPVLPQHVIYARWVFLKAEGSVLTRSQVFPIAVN